MTKKRIVLLLFLDLLLMAGVGYMAWTRYLQLQAPLKPAPVKKSWAKPAPVETLAAEPAAPTPAVPEESAPAAPAVQPVPEPAPAPLVAPVAAPAPEKAPLPKKAAAPVKPAAPKAKPVVKAPAPKPAPPPARTSAPANTPSRLTFSYFNSQAKFVQIVGDFNGWTPTAYQRNASGLWTVSVVLRPGDYSYNLVVDGKTILDPAQKRTDEQGRSLLTVPPK